MLNIADGEF